MAYFGTLITQALISIYSRNEWITRLICEFPILLVKFVLLLIFYQLLTNLEFFRKNLGLGVPEKDHSCIHQIFFATTHSSTPVFFNVPPSNYALSLVSLFATIIRFQTLSMKSKLSIGSKIRSKMFVCCFAMLLNLL